MIPVGAYIRIHAFDDNMIYRDNLDMHVVRCIIGSVGMPRPKPSAAFSSEGKCCRVPCFNVDAT